MCGRCSTLNRGEHPAFYFWRDSNGNEIDLIVEQGAYLMPIEIKSGRTLTRDSFAGMEKWCALAGKTSVSPTLIFGGDEAYRHKEINVLGWRQCPALFDTN
jgi:predicted AAA+ superfamily ATPase